MNNPERPNLVNAIALWTILSGLINLAWGPVVILGSLGYGVLCAPLMTFNVVLGAFELAYGLKLRSSPPVPVQPSQSIAIWEIISMVTGNLFSVIAGILSLVFYNDVVVRAYFARLNGAPAASPPPPAIEPPDDAPDQDKRVFG